MLFKETWGHGMNEIFHFWPVLLPEIPEPGYSIYQILLIYFSGLKLVFFSNEILAFCKTKNWRPFN